jgi:hypothetical protein
MAIDPRISLAAQAPKFGVSNAINIFENAMMNSQTRDSRQAQEARAQELAPFQLQQAKDTQAVNRFNMDLATENRVLKSINDFAVGNASLIQDAQSTGDPTRLKAALIQRRSQLINQGLPTETTDDSLALIDSGKMGQVISGLGDAVNLFNQGKSGQRATTPAAVLETEWFNKQTPEVQETHLKIQRGDQLTPGQKLDHAQAIADIDIATTAKKVDLTQAAQRKSKQISGYTQQVKAAKGTLMKTREIKKLAEKASQGAVGQGKLLASKFFSGIDASDEGALASAYLSLTMDELAKFQGPTTDFEFGVSEQITGSLGQSAAANAARVASLSRASWFALKEAKQFNKWIDKGHSSDRFGFDFNEPMTFGKGDKALTISLQDLRDTAAANHVTIEEAIKQFSKGRG